MIYTYSPGRSKAPQLRVKFNRTDQARAPTIATTSDTFCVYSLPLLGFSSATTNTNATTWWRKDRS
jgi:hypothetical protein